MNYIFKVTNLTPPTVPTVADTNFWQHYAGINQNMAWQEILPTLRTATQNYLLPFIGEELYNDLSIKFVNGTVLTTDQATALEYMQDALAHYTVYELLPHKITALTSSGVMDNTPGESQPTNQWRYFEKRLATLASADAALDRLLGHVNKKLAESDPYFDLYKNSDAATHKNSEFIKTAADLGEYLNTKDSRRTFISLIPYIRRAEDQKIKGTFCASLYNLVIAAPNNPLYIPLAPMIKEAVAYLGAAEALPHHRVVVDGDGFRVVSQTDGFQDRRNLTNSMHDQAIGSLLTSYKTRGQDALRRLVAFLEANIDDYPTYRDSTCRSAEPEKGHGIIGPSDGIGAVGVF